MNNDFCFKLKKSFKIDLKHLIFLAFFKGISNLYYLSTQKRKYDYLKFSFLVPNLLTLHSDALVL